MVAADTSPVAAVDVQWRPLGRLLVERGLLSEEQLEHALGVQAANGLPLGRTLVELGIISSPTLSRMLVAQHGTELTAADGFGTGLWSAIERRHGRGDEVPPSADAAEPTPPEPEEEEVQDELLLEEFERTCAKLAAVEERLAEAERELASLRAAADPVVEAVPGHVAFVQLAARYALVERDGEPPAPGTTFHEPGLGEEGLLAERLGVSPLPGDRRRCVFARLA